MRRGAARLRARERSRLRRERSSITFRAPARKAGQGKELHQPRGVFCLHKKNLFILIKRF
jgi:hypothetical protein